MKHYLLFNRLAILAISLSLFGSAHADHCKGQHKDFPECSSVSVAATTIVDAALIDRANNQMTFLGSGFSGTTSVDHAGNSLTNITVNGTGTELYVPFETVFSTAVQKAGTYIFAIDGSDVTVYIDGAIPNTSLACPCTSDWGFQFNNPAGILVSIDAVNECVEAGTQISTTLSEIDQTVFSDYPKYIVGAVFDGTSSSECSTTKVDSSGSLTTPTKFPITSSQQSDCAGVMKANPVICK